MGWQDAPEVEAAPAWMSAPEVTEEPKKKEDKLSIGDRYTEGLKRATRDLVGLPLRYAIEGPVETLGVLTEPIRAGLNMIPGANIESSAADTGRMIADRLGLPSPEAPNERIVAQASKLLTGSTPIIKGSQLAAKGAEGVSKAVLGRVAEAPLTQGVSAGTAGAAGGYVRETGGGPVAEIAASLAGGLAGAGAVGLVNSLKGSISGLVNSFKGSRIPDADINVRIEKAIRDSGLSLKHIPKAVRSQLAKEVRKAKQTGGEVDEAVLRRIADYGSVGATPTRGKVTLDPVAITQEENLAKIGANSGDPRLQELARIRRNNDLTLTRNLNELGAGTAQEPLAAGEQMITALRGVDAPRKAAVDSAYQAVRDAQGRYAGLNTYEFSKLANNALDEQMLGSVLPGSAKALLNDVSSGKIPLNVNTAVQIDKRLSGLARDAMASGDSQGALAIRQIRDALNKTPVESGAGQDAMQLYDKARQMAAQRFRSIEATPALEAALDNVAPDKFVQTFIVGSGSKSNARDVANLAKELKRSPEAFESARAQILAHLKSKALSGNADETGNFSPSAYKRALDSIGAEKLKHFFSAEEAGKLRAVGRVAAYEKFQPSGSAVNNSNTGSAVAGLLEKIGSNPLVGRIPFGNLAVQEPAMNWAAQIRAKEALNPLNALIRQQEAPRNALIPFAALPGTAAAISSRTGY